MSTRYVERPRRVVASERELDFEVIRGASGIIAILEEFRGRAGTPKAELARRLDVHREAISRLLAPGDTNPTLKSVVRLLAALGLNMEVTIREARPDDEHLVEVAGEFDRERKVAGENL